MERELPLPWLCREGCYDCAVVEPGGIGVLPPWRGDWLLRCVLALLWRFAFCICLKDIGDCEDDGYMF